MIQSSGCNDNQTTKHATSLIMHCNTWAAHPSTLQAAAEACGCVCCPAAVQCIKYCLEHRFGFKAPGCIVVLTDDQKHPDYTSTRANIMRGIQWLMQVRTCLCLEGGISSLHCRRWLQQAHQQTQQKQLQQQELKAVAILVMKNDHDNPTG